MRQCCVFSLTVLLLLAGCMSQVASRSDIAKGYISEKFADIIKTPGIEMVKHKSSVMPSGNTLYVIDGCPENEYNAPTPDRDCFYALEVDMSGIVIDATVIE